MSNLLDHLIKSIDRGREDISKRLSEEFVAHRIIDHACERWIDFQYASFKVEDRCAFVGALEDTCQQSQSLFALAIFGNVSRCRNNVFFCGGVIFEKLPVWQFGQRIIERSTTQFVLTVFQISDV